MKKISLFLFVLLALAACAPAPLQTSEVSKTSEVSPSSTPTPPATPTRIATATSLAVVVPESLKNTDLSFEVPQNVEQVKNWTGDLYKLGLKTGMRQGEMFGLTWKNADLERAEIHIRRNFPASEKATSRFVSPHSKPGTAAAPSPSGRIWLRC